MYTFLSILASSDITADGWIVGKLISSSQKRLLIFAYAKYGSSQIK